MNNKIIHKEINILGYSGSYLALLFETLVALQYTENITIIKNENTIRTEASFASGLNYSETHCSELKQKPTSNFIFCSNKPTTKKFLFNFYHERWRIKENDFISLIHPASVIASTAIFYNGLYIEPLSIVSPYSEIGFGVTLNRNSSIGHHNKIGEFCSIHPGANLCGHVELGENVTIGAGTTVFPRVKIGKNSIIGGGSVVTKDIPDNVLAFGNPCKIIKKI